MSGSRWQNRWRRLRGIGASAREQSAIARGFDLGIARWLVTLCLVLLATNFFPQFAVIASVVNVAFGALMLLYFAWILFFRLQCSLLELCVVIGVLGNVEGLLLTTPAAPALHPLLWPLAFLVAAWILYGAVCALAQARILDLNKTSSRLILLASNWYFIAAPALLAASAVLYFGSNIFISPKMITWAGPLALCGSVGIVAGFWHDRKVTRHAREILKRAASQ